MREFRVSTKHIPLDLESGQHLSDVPPEQVGEVLGGIYGFLPGSASVQLQGDEVVVRFSEERPGSRESATKAFEKGLTSAQHGEYRKAAELFEKAVRDLPAHMDARRNLAMAHLESGDVSAAKKYLLELLRLNPNDQWAVLLAANLFKKHERNLAVAEQYYDLAYSLDPADPYILTSCATLWVETGHFDRAEEMFREAIAADRTYPNSYLGLTLVLLKQGKYNEALASLDELFTLASSEDPRSRPIMQEGRRVFTEVMQAAAEANRPEVDAFVEKRKRDLEEMSGHKVVVEEDRSLKLPSRTELAWKHNADVHRVLYRPASRPIKVHQLVRCLEQIDMETEARATGRNMTFRSTEATRQMAMSGMGTDAYKVRDLGLPENAVDAYMDQIITGTVSQLYNCPLDMVIEKRIHALRSIIRPHQFVSMHDMLEEGIKVAASKDIRRTTPRIIYRASCAMNYAYALFTDELHGGKTDYATRYPEADYRTVGQKLLGLWHEAIIDFSPGDEYDLMQRFAEVLGLEGWFEVLADVTDATLAGYTPPPIDQDALKSRDPATLMYLVSALQRLAPMSDEDVRRIAMEISLLGMRGISFNDPDKRYMLQSLPAEEFTGLQLLAMMYAGWKRIEPAMETGLDFADLYEQALRLVRGSA